MLLLGVAERIRLGLAGLVHVEELSLAIRASIGIAVRDDPAMSVTDLLRRDDVAMYEAKSSRAGALLYDPSQDSFSRERLRLVEELRRAITDD